MTAKGKSMKRLPLLLLLVVGTALSEEQVREATPKEIEAIRTAMERDLHDAQSARFNSVRVKGNDMCGLVNAKNLMGAYVGYRPFTGMVFKDQTGKLLAAPMGVDSSPVVVRAICADKGIPLPP